MEFKLFQPWAPFVSDISLYANAIVPKNLGGASEKAFFANPVGTGPFMLKSWAQQGAEITMAKNPNYWQPGKPYVDEVLFKVILDDNQRVLQVQSGEVQIIDTVPPAQFSTLKATSGLQTTAFPAWSSDLVFFNQKVPHFADRNVRRAIAYAIDTKQIAQATTFGTAEAGGSFFAPSLEFYDPNTPVLAYNIDAAKQEIAKSGYPKGFTTEILIPTGNQVWAQSAQIIQDSVKNIGITLKINAVDHAAYENDFRAFNYDIMINNAINDISDPDEWASFMVDAKKGGSDSFWTGYNNPEATKLVRQAAVEMDSAKRGALYSQVQAIVAGDAPYVALTYPPSIYAWQASVHGFAVNPGGAYLLEDVWVRGSGWAERLAIVHSPTPAPGVAGGAGHHHRDVLLAAADPRRSGIDVAGDSRRRRSRSQALHDRWGLDRPIWVQFWLFLKQLAHGDTGASLFYGVSTRSLIVAEWA